MEILEWIIKIGGAITALGVIIGVIVLIVHFADDIKKIKQHMEENSHISEDVKEIKRHTKENHLSCLRLTVMSRDMPLGERIIAGNDYIKEGGNGEIKKFIINELHANEVVDD